MNLDLNTEGLTGTIILMPASIQPIEIVDAELEEGKNPDKNGSY